MKHLIHIMKVIIIIIVFDSPRLYTMTPDPNAPHIRSDPITRLCGSSAGDGHLAPCPQILPVDPFPFHNRIQR